MPTIQTLEIVDSKWPCGFCASSPGNERHDLCPSAVESNGKAMRCPCGCERSRQIRCFTCNRREDESGTEISHETWRCLDVDACAAELEARLATNPTIALIRSIAREDGQKADKPTLPRTSPAQRRTSRACLHCGEPTKGGLFLPGHDAAWLSQMVKELEASHPGNPELRRTMAEDRVGYMREKGCSDALIAKFQKRVG